MVIKCEKCKTQVARYKIKEKGNLPERCFKCKKDDMVKVTRKFCEVENCPFTATYGYEKSSFCAKHKKSDMKDIRHKTCEKCDKIPTFNYEGEKMPRFCEKDAEIGMVNVKDKRCAHYPCRKTPSYNFEGESPLYCTGHAKKGMIYLKGKLCRYEGCPRFPTHNFENVTPIVCSLHIENGMVDTKHGKCTTEGCRKSPSYNFIGNIQPAKCAEHKEEGMEDVKNDRCEQKGCIHLPSFASKGERPRFCGLHKKDGMINVRQSRCEKCDKSALFNFEGKKPRFCGDHKSQDMINLRANKCEFEGCNTTPNYNYKGEKTGRFCNEHKEPRMVDIKNKLCEHGPCPVRVNYGYLFSKPARCAKHKLPNMFPRASINPKCVARECKDKAYFCPKGLSYPERCEIHKKEDDVNIIEKTCKLCGDEYLIPEDQDTCIGCREFKDPIIRKSKETRIVDLIKASGFTISSADSITENSCSKYRPDAVIDFPMFDVIVEVDEDQHSTYACDCEVTRMIQIHQDLGGKPVVFIRYNPDNYKDCTGHLVRGKNQNPKREARLLNLLKRLKNADSIPMLSVYYLYYNGDDGVDRRIIMDYWNHKVTEIADTVTSLQEFEE